MHVLVDSLVAKKPDASLVAINAENWSESLLPELIAGQGLFERKKIVVLDGLLVESKARDALLGAASDIAASPNIFIVLDGPLLPSAVKQLEKHAVKVQVFDTNRAAEKKFDIFSLADAFGRRDRKQLWVLYQRAKMAGISDEEILHLLFWQTKAIVSAAEAGSANEAGLKPFVFSKASGFLRSWRREECFALLSALLALYHDARRGVRDLETALERFLLHV